MSAIDSKYQALGGAGSPLGAPVGDEHSCPDGVGRYRHYALGSIHWHPDTGAHVSHGAIRDAWASLGWEAGPLGYATTDEVDWALEDGKVAGRLVRYQRGVVLWNREQNQCYRQGEDGALEPVGGENRLWRADYEAHSHYYSESGFTAKIGSVAKIIVRPLVIDLLILFYALIEGKMPPWAKAVIVAALGYFINPLDMIPDPLPMVGYSDDALVIAAALATVRHLIPEEAVRKARERAQELLG